VNFVIHNSLHLILLIISSISVHKKQSNCVKQLEYGNHRTGYVGSSVKKDDYVSLVMCCAWKSPKEQKRDENRNQG